MSDLHEVELRLKSPELRYSVRIPHSLAAQVIQFLATKEYLLEPIKLGRPRKVKQ